MSKEKKECISKPRPHNFEGLRDILFDEINLLRSGEVSNSRARTVSQLARRIIEATTLDLYAQNKLDGIPTDKLKRLANYDTTS